MGTANHTHMRMLIREVSLRARLSHSLCVDVTARFQEPPQRISSSCMPGVGHHAYLAGEHLPSALIYLSPGPTVFDLTVSGASKSVHASIASARQW